MDKRGCFIAQDNDHSLTARVYFTAEEHERMLNEKALKIQCFVRQHIARAVVARRRAERAAFRREREEKERQRKLTNEKRKQKEVERRLHPRSTKDFDILYNGLEG